MHKNGENTYKVLSHRKNLKFKLVLEGGIIGCISGIVMVFYRIAIEKFGGMFKDFYAYSKGNPLRIFLVFILLGILGFIVGKMVKREPMISGSGIPQVEGILIRKLDVNWFKVLFYKFFGGIIGLAAGLSVGREGPSVQMGASVGQGYSKICKRINIEEKFLTTSGASAGLAAAFNAPLAGVIFALEEVHKNFSTLVLLSAMAASLVSDFISKQFLGLQPSLNFSKVQSLPLKYYWTLVILGIIVGITGVIFNKGILDSQKLYGKFNKIPIEVKVMIPFLMAGVIGLTAPILLGGGHNLIMSLADGMFPVKLLLLFLVVKFIFTLVSFGSGAPGGIFFPLLVLGALIGDIFGIGVCSYIGIPKIYIVNFIILAMAGHFTSIVKAPITGIVLITEMTGSFQHLLPLALVSIFAYITSDLLKSEPIYESLLERLLEKGKNKFVGNPKTKALLECCVCMGSTLEHKVIKDITWPKECLLVSIRRGEREIIPKGNTKILSGDYLVILVNEDDSAEIFEKIKSMSTELEGFQKLDTVSFK